jgi:hypothetical protein
MTDPSPPDDVLAFYGSRIEADRLARGEGALEFARTRELLLRSLPPAGRVADVGGGTAAMRNGSSPRAIRSTSSAPRRPGCLPERSGGNRRRRVTAEKRRAPFPDAYFHLPDELEDELSSAGLDVEGVFAVEGLAVIAPGSTPRGRTKPSANGCSGCRALPRRIRAAVPSLRTFSASPGTRRNARAARTPPTRARGPARPSTGTSPGATDAPRSGSS